MNITDPSLVLDLPLHKLDGPIFASKDAYGHLCTVTGALWRPDGRRFALGDVIDVGRAPAASIGTGDFAMSAWVNLNEITTDDSPVIMSRGIATGNDWMLRVTGAGAGGTAGFRFPGATSINSATLLRGSGWHLIDVVREWDIGCIYVDSILEGTTTGVADLDINSTTDLTISNIAAVRRWEGDIGDAQIYTRARSPQEIQRRYVSTKWRYTP